MKNKYHGVCPNPLSLLLAMALLGPALSGGAEAPSRGVRSFASDLDAWAAHAVSARPPATARKPGPPARPVGAPAATVGSLVERFTPFSAATAAAASLTRVAGEEGNEVWSARFQEPAGGAIHEFASHLRPDDHRPLYWRASGLPAYPGATFEKAAQLVKDKVLGPAAAKRLVKGWGQIMVAADTRLRNWSGPLTAPWEQGWFFFVDDAPQNNWEHPCRYVFVAADLSAFAVQYGRTPVTFEAQQNGVLVVQSLQVVVPYVPEATVSVLPQAGAVAKSPSLNGLDFSGSAENCYAVIISGGCNPSDNHIRYWDDASFMYSTLTKKYGYLKSHIYTLIADGTNPAVDRDDGVSSPSDLDGDGVGDINYSATRANVATAFNTLGGVLTSNDQVMVFVTDHGGQGSGHNAVLWLWGGDTEYLWDSELADMVADYPCPVMVAMETCFSGGFVDNLDQTNQVIATACAYNDTSVAGTTFPDYDQWAYYFTAALRGYYPGAHPWTDGTVCNADANGDGRVSFKEASDFAYANRNASDVPQYGSTPSGLGATLFMDQAQVDLVNGVPATYSTVPKDFSFQVMNYDWAIVGLAPSTDHDLQADEDRLFSAPYQSSTLSGTVRDFIVVNGHQLSANARNYARVYYGSASSYTIQAQWEATDMTFGGASASDSFAANEVSHLYEVYLSAGQEADVAVNVASGTADLSIFVFKPTRASGKRTAYDWATNAAGAGGSESLLLRADTSGYYGIALLNENGGTANYTLRVAPPPPLAAPTGLAVTDGGYSDRIRVTWNSVSLATHYMVYRSTANDSSTAMALTGWQTALTYDDLTVAAGQLYYYWVKAAASSEGSRVSGFSAGNSGFVAPATLTSDVRVNTTTEPAYYQFRDPNYRWWAVGVRYNGAGENWSLRLYSDATFSTLLTNSAYVVPVDFIVGDGHHVTYQYRGVEVLWDFSVLPNF